MNKYEVIIYWSEEDQAFVAEVPELPGCAAHGSTQESALANAQEGEMDPVKRKQIIDQAQDRLYELMPYHPAISRIFYHAVSCRVRNYIQIQPGYNAPSPVYAWIDPTGC